MASRNCPRYAARRPAQTMLSALGSPRALSQAAAKSASSFAREASGTGGRINGFPSSDVASGRSGVWFVDKEPMSISGAAERKKEKEIPPFLPSPVRVSSLSRRAREVGHRLCEHLHFRLIARARGVGIQARRERAQRRTARGARRLFGLRDVATNGGEPIRRQPFRPLELIEIRL